MLHSLGLEKSSWKENYLSSSYQHFGNLLEYLHLKGYETVFLDEWYDSNNTNSLKDNKQIAFTFDDGYLDNWVYLFPLLKKHNQKATIFINPESVDPSKRCRSNLEDVWNKKLSIDRLQPMGFLNWPEIIKMQNSGYVDIQSHSMSHNWYFSGSNIIDFYDPGEKKYPWLAWIKYPKKKPFYMTEDQYEMVDIGTPVFEFGRSLGIRRYLPPKALLEFLQEVIEKEGKEDIVSKQNWKDYLKEKSIEFMIKYKAFGRMETDEEMVARYDYELRESKSILEKRLNKEIGFLCWPGGAYNDLCVKLSEVIGYKASTLASSQRHTAIDNTKIYKRIKRNGLSSNIYVKNRRFVGKSNNIMVTYFKILNGYKLSRVNYISKKIVLHLIEYFR